MRVGTRDRLWLLGGLVVALLLAFVAWQFFIKVQQEQTASVKEDIASADQQITDTTRQLDQLKADSANLAKYKATLAAAQQALPSDAAMPAFIRELQAAGDATGVGIAQVQVGQPQPVVAAAQAAAGPVFFIAVTVVASGPTESVNEFIKQLQMIQPRAVLVSSVTESPGAGANQAQLNLAFQVFVAPTDGKLPAAS